MRLGLLICPFYIPENGVQRGGLTGPRPYSCEWHSQFKGWFVRLRSLGFIHSVTLPECLFHDSPFSFHCATLVEPLEAQSRCSWAFAKWINELYNFIGLLERFTEVSTRLIRSHCVESLCKVAGKDHCCVGHYYYLKEKTYPTSVFGIASDWHQGALRSGGRVLVTRAGRVSGKGQAMSQP